MKKFFVILLFLLIAVSLNAQKSTPDVNDSTSVIYYNDYSDLLALKPYLLYKLNSIEVVNESDRLLLSPNSPLALGLSFNYKFAGLSLGFGLPHSSKNIDKYGRTNSLDLQVSLFRKNIGIDGYLQVYDGYYVKNPGDYMEWDKAYFPKLPGMQTVSIGLSGYYVFNHKRFSNKASVVRTQIQKRSAGSLLLGIFANYDNVSSPGGFVPEELPDSVGYDLDLKQFRYFAAGISIGYTYTFVISDNFFINLAIIPGGGFKHLRGTNSDGAIEIDREFHAQTFLRGTMGYEREHFFVGLTGSTLIRRISYKDFEIDIATEQLRFFLGKRFSINS